MLPLPLADDMWLLSHSDRTGRLLQHPRTAGLAVAGGLLAELLRDELVTVVDHFVVPGERRVAADGLLRSVLATIRSEPARLPLRSWLEFFADDAVEMAATRLAGRGLLRRVESRRLLRTVRVWVPVDVNVAGWPAARLSLAFGEHLLGHPRRDLDAHDQVLAGLVWATGLDSHLLLYEEVGSSARDGLVSAATTIAFQPLQELVLTIHALAGALAIVRA